MKTMNYLFLIGLLIFGSSCTNYSPLSNNGSEEEVPEIENALLELDLHQIYLERRDAQLVLEIEKVMANLDNGEGSEEDNISLLEELQREKDTNMALFDFNTELRSKIGNLAIIRPPKLPCSKEVDPFAICPIPRLRSVELWVFEGQEIESGVREGFEGEILEEFAGLEPAEGIDGFSVMIFEQLEEGNLVKQTITKPNPIGEGTVSYFSYYEQ